MGNKMIDAAGRTPHREAGREAVMTLQEFMTLTSAVPTSVFRRALLSALAVEVPRDQPSFARFYGRVLSELGAPEERYMAAEKELRGCEVGS